MKNYQIVKISKKRMPEIACVFRESFRNIYPNFPELHTIEEDNIHFTNTIYERNNILAAELLETKKIVGFIAYNHEFIDQLYLLPEFQKQGIGSKLINISKQNSTKLRLWTFQQNRVALKFYKKNGFSEIKKTDGAETEEKQPDVLLEWSVTNNVS